MRPALLTLALLALPLTAQDPESAQPPVATEAPRVAQNPFKPFDRPAYEAHLRKLGATDAQLQNFQKQIDEVGLSRAADDLVRSLQPDFDAAAKLAQDADPKAALQLVRALTATTDPVVAAHIRYHLARLFLDSDDPERTVEILNEYLTQSINLTPLDAEAAFFYGQALADLPEPDLAMPRLRAFLQWFPDASERFRATAQQRLAELERQQQSQLHALADRIKKVGRELKKQKTDDPIQREQKDIVDVLQQLIEQEQEKEKSGGGAPSGNQNPSGPANQSALTEGEGRIGNLEKRVSLTDRWGPMRDEDRKEIESAIQNGFSPQYRKLLEDYYKRLGITGGKGK